jgi:hypothetical protein
MISLHDAWILREGEGAVVSWIEVRMAEGGVPLVCTSVVRALHESWRGLRAWSEWEVEAFVVLPDRVQMLWVRPGDGHLPLLTAVARWKEGVVATWCRLYPALGSQDVAAFWAAGFSEQRLTGVVACRIRWLAMQEEPVRRRLVPSAEAWPFSGRRALEVGRRGVLDGVADGAASGAGAG